VALAVAIDLFPGENKLRCVSERQRAPQYSFGETKSRRRRAN
jgi:hypothetical protein